VVEWKIAPVPKYGTTKSGGTKEDVVLSLLERTATVGKNKTKHQMEMLWSQQPKSTCCFG
jgi:hypothetical protein